MVMNVGSRKRGCDDAFWNAEQPFLMFSGGCCMNMNAFNGSKKPKRFSFSHQEKIRTRKFRTSQKQQACLKLVAGSLYLPKDDPGNPRGEDSHFVCTERNCLGVADGVGGWRRMGVDAGEYARELMANSVTAIRNEPMGRVNPKRVLHEAYSNTKIDGSCTACIITLNGNVLRAANVGDSGFMLIRDGKVIYKSPVQQSYFNCPYQLGRSNNDPSVAMEIEVLNLCRGDIIVAGTDGLFDNMHAAEIAEKIISSQTPKKTDDHGFKKLPEDMACQIANLALYNSFDRYSDTPFSMAARNAGLNHVGGKVDDITVVVAYVESSETI